MTTVGWGIAITVLALVADQIDRTVIEAINKIGSAFYGPVLATFAIGLFSKRVRGQVMLAGLLAGVGINVTAWLMAWPIHWMWWNVMGGTVTVVVAQGLSMGSGIGHGRSGAVGHARGALAGGGGEVGDAVAVGWFRADAWFGDRPAIICADSL